MIAGGIRLPATAPLAGYTAGATAAMYPNLLPRSIVVQLAVVAVLGLLGAGVGAAVAGWTGRGRAFSEDACRITAEVTVVALVAWLLWQSTVRSAAGVDAVSPVEFAALATVVVGTPYLIATLVASLRGSSRRLRIALLAATVGIGAVVAPPFSASAATGPSQAQRFLAIESATPGVRAYGALTDGATPAERAAVAVDRLLAAGGLQRHAIVIAVPTGSGWVDPHFVRGVESASDGDSAIVAVQYTEQPSWQSFLFHRDAAAASTVALVDELHRRAPTKPLRIYGQSLGTVGVVAGRERAAELGHPVDATLQAGTPASVPLIGPAELNPSDPVGIWSLELAISPPQREPSGPGRPTPRPLWLPVIGFVQATVDLLGATAPPSGLGHRYDDHQGSALITAPASTAPSRT